MADAALADAPTENTVSLTMTCTVMIPSSNAPVPGIEKPDLQTFLTELTGFETRVDRLHKYSLSRWMSGGDIVVPHFVEKHYDEKGAPIVERAIDVSPVAGSDTYQLKLTEGARQVLAGIYPALDMALAVGDAWIDRRIDL